MKKKLFKRSSISINWFLTRLLISMVFLQCALLLIALHNKSFYDRVNQQSVDVFFTRSNQQVEAVNNLFSNIVKDTSLASSKITSIYSIATASNGKSLSNTELTVSTYSNAHIATSGILLELLKENAIDSAFYILDYQLDGDAIFIEIDNIYPNLQGNGNSAYELVAGTSQISKAYGLGINSNWSISIDPDMLLDDLYTKPLEAVSSQSNSFIERYGYWSVPSEKTDTSRITYTLPLIDEYGNAYGIIGVGISNSYFEEHYVNRSHYSLEDSFYLIAGVDNNVIYTKPGISNSEYSMQYVKNQTKLSDENVLGFQLFSSSADDIGDILIKIDNLSMYSEDSPFLNEQLSYLTVVPKSQLFKYSNEIIDIFITSFGLSLIFCIVISVFAGRSSTRKIQGLSRIVQKMHGYEKLAFPTTYFKEIDNFTEAIVKLTQRVENSDKTINNLLKLTELNLGGFKVIDNENSVQVTEYICKLLNIEETDRVDLSTWITFYKKLKSDVIDKEKHIFVYWLNDTRLYLKILQTAQPEGMIGTILDVTKEIEEIMDAKYQLDYDALTKLYSRQAFYRKSTELIEENRDSLGAMLFIDLDNLKYVNDTYGHDFGDLYLITASKLFADFAQNGGVAARMSGDEFAIYVHNFETKEQVLDIIDRRFEEFKKTSINLPDGSIQKISFSTGISWYFEDSCDITKLVKYSDFSMYEAKQTVKGSIKQFDINSYNQKIFMMENTEAINQLIFEKQVDFMFQPIICLKTGEILAYEALMRSKLDAFKSPLEILKVATAQYKLTELENMIICKAIEEAYEHRAEIGSRQIFINSITSQTLPKDVFEELKNKYGDFLTQIVIEITEAEDNTPEKMRQKVSSLRDCGMQIAIDDFGRGYSNELKIVSINPDIVKIDMILVQDLHNDSDKRMLCATIISHCHSKNIKVIAEGIEKFEDLQSIISLDVDMVQGFYLMKPSFAIKTSAKDKQQEIIDINNNLLT